MRKRVAEKVLSRAILSLAVYPKRTMASALRRRPKFWTETKSFDGSDAGERQIKLKFAEHDEDTRFTIEYAPGALDPRDDHKEDRKEGH